MRWTAWALLLFIPFPVHAQEKVAPKFVKDIYIAPENSALFAAVTDAKTIPPRDLVFTRWAMLHGDLEVALRQTALTCWYLQVTPKIVRPQVVTEKLVRIDIRHYASRQADLKRWLDTWEELRYDPAFSLNLDKSTRKFNLTVPGIKAKVKVITPTVVDGKVTTKIGWKEVDAVDSEEDVLRIPSPHLDQEAWLSLVLATGSEAPIVDFEYFAMRGLRSIKDAAVNKAYAEIYGGLYYDFKGITTGNKEGTDEDNLLEKLGIGNVKAKKTPAQVFDELRSDLRTLTYKSGVTGGERRTDILDTLTGGKYLGKVLITRDLKRANRGDIAKLPSFNLLQNGIHDGVELIAVATNGSHVFYIGDGAGKRAEVVPSDIANDTTIPKGEPQELEAPLSCIICHGIDGGWKPITDNFRRKKGNLGIFPDKDDDEIDRIGGLFQANLEQRIFPRLRDDYASAMLLASGPWKAAKLDQTDIVQTAAESFRALRLRYSYTPITAEYALERFGIAFKKGEAVEVWEKLLPPVKLIVERPASLRIPEDPSIDKLKTGDELSRFEWDRIRAVVATRIKENVK